MIFREDPAIGHAGSQRKLLTPDGHLGLADSNARHGIFDDVVSLLSGAACGSSSVVCDLLKLPHPLISRAVDDVFNALIPGLHKWVRRSVDRGEVEASRFEVLHDVIVFAEASIFAANAKSALEPKQTAAPGRFPLVLRRQT